MSRGWVYWRFITHFQNVKVMLGRWMIFTKWLLLLGFLRESLVSYEMFFLSKYATRYFLKNIQKFPLYPWQLILTFTYLHHSLPLPGSFFLCLPTKKLFYPISMSLNGAIKQFFFHSNENFSPSSYFCQFLLNAAVNVKLTFSYFSFFLFLILL
jgi:hypothetical protein